VPDKIRDPVTTTIVGTTVKIEWLEPDSLHGAVLTKYVIKFKTKPNGDFLEDTTNCDGSSTDVKTNYYCSVPMLSFQLTPHNLILNDDIIAIVYAENIEGSSLPSD
jgi:hypothetical protein